MSKCDDCGITPGYEGGVFCTNCKPLTNADRVRGMSDEELAEWLEKIRLYCATDLCGKSCPLAEVCYSNANAPKETLDWLREEA